MARKNESLLNLLARLPWWVSLALGVVVYVFFRFVIPLFSFSNPIINGLGKFCPQVAPVLLVLLVFVSIVSALLSWRSRHMLDAQRGLDTVKNLSWRDFETLVGEVFRRKGYSVLENPGDGPNGGVDLRLRKDGKKSMCSVSTGSPGRSV